jgi:hypothetical protein
MIASAAALCGTFIGGASVVGDKPETVTVEFQADDSGAGLGYISIRNQSARIVHIEDARPFCSCVRLGQVPRQIRPSGEARIPIVLAYLPRDATTFPKRTVMFRVFDGLKRSMLAVRVNIARGGRPP